MLTGRCCRLCGRSIDVPHNSISIAEEISLPRLTFGLEQDVKVKERFPSNGSVNLQIMFRQQTRPEELQAASDDSARHLADESAPLLGDDESEQLSKRSPFTQPISALNIAVYISYFIALELGQTFPAHAFHQVVEENLCRLLHGRTDADYCGAADDVQSALAVLMGWYTTAQLVPGLSFDYSAITYITSINSPYRFPFD